MKSGGCKVRVHPEQFAVVNVNEMPENVEFFAMVRDPEGITLILPESELGKVGETLGCERGFRLITFDTILPSDLVGFISKVTTALAEKGVSVLVISSYSTDHVLVKEKDLEEALEVLEDLGFEKVIT